MIAAIRQNLPHLRFRNSPPLYESNVVFLVPALCFSKSVEGHSTVYELLVHKHHFPPKSASEIASVVTHMRNPVRSDSVLCFLKQSGFSNPQLEKALKIDPQLLSLCLERTIKPRIQAFRDFGLSPGIVVEIFANNPGIFRRSVTKRIIPSLSVLKSFFGLNELSNVKEFSWFFRTNLDNTLVPNVELLKTCGVSMDQLCWLAHHYPRVLVCKHENLKKVLDRVDAMGIKRSSRKFINALRLICSFTGENWEAKLKNLRDVGFSDNDISTAFRKAPEMFGLTVENLESKIKTLREMGFSNDDIAAFFRTMPTVFQLSKERIKKAKDILLSTGKFELFNIARNPVSLTVSIENRIEPRLQVLKLLESKNLIRRWPSLGSFCCTSNDNFNLKYVAPFRDQIGDVTIRKNTSC